MVAEEADHPIHLAGIPTVPELNADRTGPNSSYERLPYAMQVQDRSQMGFRNLQVFDMGYEDPIGGHVKTSHQLYLVYLANLKHRE
tara:strand:+ start:143 stop:400 length:258 start_codon:yes stop_codon:yes gene_type:complete